MSGATLVAAESDSIVYFATAQDVYHHDILKDMVTNIVVNANPTGLTVHMGSAYWPSQADNTIHKGKPADGEDVYWITREGKIHRYSNQKHVEAGPLVMGMNVSSGRVAVRAEHVYWLGPDMASCALGWDCGSDCGAVWRAPKSDITQPPEKFASMDWALLKGLAVDATHVYWTTEGADAKLLRKAH